MEGGAKENSAAVDVGYRYWLFPFLGLLSFLVALETVAFCIIMAVGQFPLFGTVEADFTLGSIERGLGPSSVRTT